MPFKKVGLNTSSLFLKHVLYNGCILYVPLQDEEERAQTKAYLRSFNSWQMEQFKPEPETA